ncbi:MAG: four helix bundle protein [Kiritimatiellia bacterium]
MGNLFGHENLLVYKASVDFVLLGDSLLKVAGSKPVACNHLSRAMEGIPLHIAHANCSWSAKERISYLGHANGSALECAACLDVLLTKRLLNDAQVIPGKRLLRQVCGMLIAMQKNASGRVCEEPADIYTTNRDLYFNHERLDVYRCALVFVAWVDDLCRGQTGRHVPEDRLDNTSTSIALNIAEGNGRFSSIDHLRFIGIARTATVQATATLDLAVARHVLEVGNTQVGRQMLERIGAMLTAMARNIKTRSRHA